MLDINVYQKWCKGTATYDGRGEMDGLMYLALGLNGEAGEVAEKIKKMFHGKPLLATDVAKELGDVMWYVAELASCFGFEMSDILDMNFDKLEARLAQGKILGEGDGREEEGC